MSASRRRAINGEDLAPVFADALEKAVKDAEAATGAQGGRSPACRAPTEAAGATSAPSTRRCRAASKRIQPRVPATRCTRVGGAADFAAGAVLDWLHAHIGQYPELEVPDRLDRRERSRPHSVSRRPSQPSRRWRRRRPQPTTTGEPPTGEEREKLLEKQKELNLELDKAKQKLLDIKTEEAGGTETSKTKLAIDEADAKQKGDAVENAKKLQAAAEADLANAEKTGATQERLTKLKTEVAKATEAVTTAEEKQAESTARLEVAKAKAAGDTEKEKAAELAVADLKIKAAGADVAARQAAEAEKLSIETRYAEQSKSLALEKANEEIAAARTAAQNKIKDIDLEAKAKQISESQKVALTKAALAEEIAAEKSIYEQELALDNLRPAERQKILAQLQAAEEQVRPEDEGDPTQGGRGQRQGVESDGRQGRRRAVLAGQRRHQRHDHGQAGVLQHGEVHDRGRRQISRSSGRSNTPSPRLQVMAQNTAVTTSAHRRPGGAGRRQDRKRRGWHRLAGGQRRPEHRH